MVLNSKEGYTKVNEFSKHTNTQKVSEMYLCYYIKQLNMLIKLQLLLHDYFLNLAKCHGVKSNKIIRYTC